MADHKKNLPKDAIRSVRIFTGNVNNVTIQVHLGVSTARMPKVVRKEDDVRYNHTTSKPYEMKQTPNHVQRISEFCHSNESSVIDSNSRKIIKVDGEEHTSRVWVVPTVREQYILFEQLEAVEKYKNLDPNFLVPSISFFIISVAHV